jgi:hypothetical protein
MSSFEDRLAALAPAERAALRSRWAARAKERLIRLLEAEGLLTMADLVRAGAQGQKTPFAAPWSGLASLPGGAASSAMTALGQLQALEAEDLGVVSQAALAIAAVKGERAEEQHLQASDLGAPAN